MNSKTDSLTVDPVLPVCPNPRCVAAHNRWPKGNKELISVPEVHACRSDHVPGSIARCGHCGAYWTGKVWVYRCLKCKKDVLPNTLKGMWVPHSCKECEDKDIAEQKARGAVCTTCRNVFSYCYC